MPHPHEPPSPLRLRLVTAAAAIGLLTSACGAGESDVGIASVSEAMPPATTADAATPSPAEPDASSTEPQANAAQDQAPPDASDATQPSVADEAAAALNQLPDVDVVDLATGGEVNLRTLAPADKPIVLWFWAPH